MGGFYCFGQVYLNDVDRFLCVFFKQHHGGGVCVHIELLQQPTAVFVTLVHVGKAHEISEGKRCELEYKMNREGQRAQRKGSK